MKKFLLLAFMATWPAPAAAQSPPRIYQSVTVSADRIAFVFGGQIWEVPRAGGAAQRISTARDDHAHVLYSPDGARLAYSRANALWLMPAGGGEERRLTWYPRAPFPRAWTPDGKAILFVSARDGDGNMRGFTVPAAGGPETMLKLDPVRFASYSPDGKRIALVGRSMFLSGVDRRYARGGMRDPIALVDPETGRGPSIPVGNANAIFPMWVGDKVYFATDSLGSFNLAVYDTNSKRIRLLTNWKSHGITAASEGGGAIAFVRDGRIHLFDVATERITTPAIDIAADTTELAPKSAAAAPFVQFVSVAPRAERVAIEARGDVLLVDPRTGEARNLTASPGAAERMPVISPDGRLVAYFSDASGEYALHVRAVDGSGTVRMITLGERPTFFRSISWSADARRIAFSDQRLVLWVADVAAGRAVTVDSSRWIAQDLWQTSWSPDGQLLAYSKANPKGIRAVWLRDVATNQAWQLSSGGSDDVWPVFDPTGRWLYFASSTSSGNAPARGVWGLLSDVYARPFVSHSLMVAALRAGDVLPVLPFRAGTHPQAKHPPTGPIDPAGASARVAPLGLPQRFVEQIWMAPQGSLVVQAAVWPATPATGGMSSEVLLADPLAPQSPAIIAANVRGAEVSSDGSALVVRRGNDWSTLVIGGDSAKIDLSTATVRVEPRTEWRQIYREAFRMMRDYFYDPAHHGVDMASLEKHYAAYVPELTRRSDLSDLLYYAFGEVSISHLGIGGGDEPNTPVQPERVGVLGADYTIENGRYRFERIMRNGPYQLMNMLTRAPLDQPGVDVKEGEYLLAVDSLNVTADRPVDFFLVGKAGRVTTIRVGPSADGAGARDVMVVPTAGENGLRRANWAAANRREVERRSAGQLAYVHIDGWNPAGLSELYRVLNGSPAAKGLIIDERWNGGGITPDAAIDALERKPWYAYLYRYGDGFTVPHHFIEGPKVLIVHESNGSAAETFALMFKERRVGTIVGRRTGGGGIGGALFYQPLVDGGRITIPNRASYNSRLGSWDIENYGVEPDVGVPLTQEDAVAGRDPQLSTAIDLALKTLRSWRPGGKKRPAMPVHPAREP
jgi:tricorn protease